MEEESDDDLVINEPWLIDNITQHMSYSDKIKSRLISRNYRDLIDKNSTRSVKNLDTNTIIQMIEEGNTLGVYKLISENEFPYEKLMIFYQMAVKYEQYRLASYINHYMSHKDVETDTGYIYDRLIMAILSGSSILLNEKNFGIESAKYYPLYRLTLLDMDNIIKNMDIPYLNFLVKSRYSHIIKMIFGKFISLGRLTQKQIDQFRTLLLGVDMIYNDDVEDGYAIEYLMFETFEDIDMNDANDMILFNHLMTFKNKYILNLGFGKLLQYGYKNFAAYLRTDEDYETLYEVLEERNNIEDIDILKRYYSRPLRDLIDRSLYAKAHQYLEDLLYLKQQDRDEKEMEYIRERMLDQQFDDDYGAYDKYDDDRYDDQIEPDQ